MEFFDKVSCICLKCKEGIVSWKSKAGECSFCDYSIGEVPVEIANDIDRTCARCNNCGTRFVIKNITTVKKIPMIIEEC